MKNTIDKIGMFVAVIIILSSCSKYTVASFQPDQNNGSDCLNPIYIGTMSKSAMVQTINNDMTSSFFFDQQKMTLVSLLDEAKKKYGEEVTIHNIRWDIKNGKKKTGVIYDVIRCN